MFSGLVLSSGAAPDLQSSDRSRGDGEHWGVFLSDCWLSSVAERERCWEKMPYQVTRRSALQQLSSPSGDSDVITLQDPGLPNTVQRTNPHWDPDGFTDILAESVYDFRARWNGNISTIGVITLEIRPCHILGLPEVRFHSSQQSSWSAERQQDATVSCRSTGTDELATSHSVAEHVAFNT